MERENGKPAIEPTTLWDFPKQSYGKTTKGNWKFNGVTPAGVIWNMLQRYTKESDIVIDPMCGSGTTIDVCKEEHRKVIGYDIAPTRQYQQNHFPKESFLHHSGLYLVV